MLAVVVGLGWRCNKLQQLPGVPEVSVGAAGAAVVRLKQLLVSLSNEMKLERVVDHAANAACETLEALARRAARRAMSRVV